MFDYFFLITTLYTADFIALVANTLVIYLVTTETVKELRDYTNVLVLNCIVDYTCTFIALFNRPVSVLFENKANSDFKHLEITNGLWVHVLGAPASLFPKKLHYVFVGSYSFTLAFGIVSLPIQFYYRYALLCR
jgi:hypothetical protein